MKNTHHYSLGKSKLKTIMRYFYTPMSIFKIERTNHTSIGKGREQQELTHSTRKLPECCI